MKKIYDYFDNIKGNERLFHSFFYTTLICLLAYGFLYTHYFFFGDMTFYIARGHVWRLYDGARWFAGIVNWFTISCKLPWLDGCLTIIFLSLVVYIVSALLKIERKLNIFFVAAVIALNDAIMFGHFFYAYSFAFPLLLACLSVYIWYIDGKRGVIRYSLSILMLVLSLGAYRAYSTFAPTLVIIILMFELIDGNKATTNILKRGIEYIVIFLASLGVYFVIARVTAIINDNPIQEYMGQDRLVKGATVTEIIGFILDAYKKSFQRFTGIYVHWHPYMQFPMWVSVLLLICATILFIMELVSARDKSVLAKILIAFLLVMFPLSAGLIYVLAFGNVHNLMLFSFSAIYLVYIVLIERTTKNIDGNVKFVTGFLRKILPYIFVIAFIFMTYKEILVANLISARLDYLENVSDKVTIQLIDRIESCEGFTGEESIILVGDINDSDYYKKMPYDYYSDAKDLLERVPFVTFEGQKNSNFTYISTIREYMLHIYGFSNEVLFYNDIKDECADNVKEELNGMVCFPFDGSVKKIGDYIWVKFSDLN